MQGVGTCQHLSRFQNRLAQSKNGYNRKCHLHICFHPLSDLVLEYYSILAKGAKFLRLVSQNRDPPKRLGGVSFCQAKMPSQKWNSTSRFGRSKRPKVATSEAPSARGRLRAIAFSPLTVHCFKVGKAALPCFSKNKSGLGDGHVKSEEKQGVLPHHSHAAVPLPQLLWLFGWTFEQV